MKTYLSLKNENRGSLPEEFQKDDVRYAEELVEHFLKEFTKCGDLVFDPFMGYGTTLVVAEKLERIGYGVEFDESRCRYVKSILKHPERAINGDSTKLEPIELPRLDFSITSPPYMGKHHKENPFTAYSTQGNGYEEYLENITSVYRQLSKKLKPSAHVVIEVSNLKHEDGTLTTLAWDIARAVSSVLSFKGETIVTWQNTYGYGYDHSYCLVFEKQ
ncbi:MAG: site-specific DNA-methyltransferase [Candidatus Obscuribacterales bacterium]|nr:site-specific DNA-methyltransferase [Candidatus Obscuribacterales bacterium]